MSEDIDDSIIDHTTKDVVDEIIEEEKEGGSRVVKCAVCGIDVPFGKLLSHYRTEHPEKHKEIMERRRRTQLAKRGIEVVEEKPEAPKPTTSLTEDDIRSIIAIEGREGLNKLKRQRFEEVLGRHPRINSKMREWLLFVWDTNEAVRDDPNYLFSTIREAGVEPTVAKSIVDAVWSLEHRYANLLMAHGIVPRWQTTTFTGAPSQLYPPTTQAQQPYYQEVQPYVVAPPTPPLQYPRALQQVSYAFPTPPQPMQQERGVTREEVAQIVRETIESLKRRDRLDMMQEEIESVRSQIEELRAFIIEGGDKVRKKGEEEQINLLIKKIDDLERQIRENEKKYYEAQLQSEKKLYEERIAVFKNEIQTLRERLQEIMELSRRTETIGGYRSDVYRLLGHVSEQLVERRPIETIARALFPERFVGPPTQKGPTIEQKYLKELESRGLVE